MSWAFLAPFTAARHPGYGQTQGFYLPLSAWQLLFAEHLAGFCFILFGLHTSLLLRVRFLVRILLEGLVLLATLVWILVLVSAYGLATIGSWLIALSGNGFFWRCFPPMLCLAGVSLLLVDALE